MGWIAIILAILVAWWITGIWGAIWFLVILAVLYFLSVV
jgi:hypothetical protein